MYIHEKGEDNKMVKRMVKHGNSSALIIDKPILELLSIDNETPLEIVTDGKNIIISPLNEIQKSENLKKSLDKVNLKYSNTLKKLAE
jgi:antitoxin component of MazEF toxin-antitoxin module